MRYLVTKWNLNKYEEYLSHLQNEFKKKEQPLEKEFGHDRYIEIISQSVRRPLKRHQRCHSNYGI